ncbi:STAS domain-containing protein [Actinoplanes hulinensis]|uniref:STAS domain-containing protein n=1 Tax=Actinoplanes hulinensis TaxID=1144547 RepID=A0ABS7B6I0_9ACTN|nr:STAS domain-containing protein [Actinoplanes hulinensis]MBW6436369.1 STAS domain-containing protein [Actinoplanes hulinensis]
MTFFSAPNDLEIDRVATAPERRVRLRVRGDLDRHTTHVLMAAVADSFVGGAVAEVELDLSGLTFVDAVGVRCLLACREAADAAGVAMVLCDPAPTVVRVLEAMGLLARLGVAGPVTEEPDRAGTSSTWHDGPGDWREWSQRVRREAVETRLRARDAVERSRAIRLAGTSDAEER